MNRATMVIRIGEEKHKKHNIQISHDSTMCLHPRERRLKIFTITEITLYRTAFIITLNMIKL